MKKESVSFALVSLVIIAGVIAALIGPAEVRPSARTGTPAASVSGAHGD